MKKSKIINTKITVIGLGYVGLPLLKSLSSFFDVQGIDNNKKKIIDLNTNNIDFEDCSFLKKNNVKIFDSIKKANSTDVYIICVPTPINLKKKPDLSILINVLKKLSLKIKKNDLVIFESTYYPGLTIQLSKKYLEKKKFFINKDFFIGYSPERINPGDSVHTLKNTFKLIACSNEKYLKKTISIYKKICKNLHICNSIEIAEMSKIIENVQRDINIAFINEILIICDKLKIPFLDVYNAASTKWNFLSFYPGLVGGHCISVDTYYLKHLTNEKKIKTQIIDSGRKINEDMVNFFKKKLDSILINKKMNTNVLFLGYSFKENVSDLRNSKNLELINIFKKDKKYNVYFFDPLVEKKSVKFFFKNIIHKFDCIYILVPHKKFLEYGFKNLTLKLSLNGLIYDPKNLFKNKNSKKLISI